MSPDDAHTELMRLRDAIDMDACAASHAHAGANRFGHIYTRIRRIPDQQDGQRRADRCLVAQLVRHAVDQRITWSNHIKPGKRDLLHRCLRFGDAHGGLALRELLAARAMFKLRQRRGRCLHLRIGIAGGGTCAIDIRECNELPTSEWLQARVIRPRIARLCLRGRQLRAEQA